MKAIIFDLFETLITEWGHEKYTKRRMATDLGVDLEAFSSEWKSLHRAMYFGEYKDFRSPLAAVLSRLNASVDADVLQRAVEKRIHTKAQCFDPIDKRVIDMLTSLKEAGYKLGLISNCSHYEIAAFETCELKAYFDVALLSCDVGMVKPDREIYELCAAKLGVLPQDCMFVGDGGSNELDGAANAGMKAMQAVWFTKSFVQNYENTAGYQVIDNPQELVRYLQS